MADAYRRQTVGFLIAVIALCALLCGALAQAPSDSVGIGTQKLKGYVFPKAPLVGPLDPSTVLTVAIQLPVRNRAAFYALARAVSDPKSPSYRKFLTPVETTRRFGPSPADYEAAIAFARAHGLRVVHTYDNRFMVTVSGTVDVVQNTFHVKMNNYRRPDGSVFFAPDREPSLDFDVPVLSIGGLDNVIQRRTHQVPFQGAGPQLPGGSQHLVASSDLRNVYTDNNPTLFGQGQVVGFLEWEAPDQADIYGNSTPGSGYVGAVSPPAGLTNPNWPANTTAPPVLIWPPSTSWSDLSTTPDFASVDEAVLDVEMAMAIAPGLDQIVVYVVTEANYFEGLEAMASPPQGYPLPLQTSNSLAVYANNNTAQPLAAMAMQGQSFFTVSGDVGSFNAPGSNCQQLPIASIPGFPAGAGFMDMRAAANATSVGGTLFSTSASAPYGESEVAWSSATTLSNWPYLWANLASGGGIGTGVPIPSYQTGFGAANGASTTYRNVPDVSAVAGELFYYFNGSPQAGLGTSAASPLWAGFTALVNQQRSNLGLTPGIGFLNPTLYSLAQSDYSANFHDVTSGDNGVTPGADGTGSCAGFTAGPGYDLVTGLGSPTGQLIYNLAAAPITAANRGDPHLTTVSGVHYDFQSAGEFVALRGGRGMEIQTRQTPVPTAAPAASDYTGLATCVSLNTAVAARVGEHRVTYQPDLNGVPDPSGLQLRVDGALTTLPANGLALGPGGRVIKSPAGDGIEVDFPDGTGLIVTSNWWPSQSAWYLNVDVSRTRALKGLMGATAPGSWLPALPNGASLGPMPGALHQRYVDLYQGFAKAWRVTDATSLFDYAPGTSTATFTDPNWPPENASCDVPNRAPAKRLEPTVAQRLCSKIEGKAMKADCIFDVTVTGEPGFAKTYLLSQRVEAGATATTVNRTKGPTRWGELVTFTATVVLTASNGKAIPAGTVQFTLDGTKPGAPLKLDATGRATWRTSRLAVGDHQVAARYSPAKGSVFLASNSFDAPHSVVRQAAK